jgi:large subunit ribosomal protein L32
MVTRSACRALLGRAREGAGGHHQAPADDYGRARRPDPREGTTVAVPKRKTSRANTRMRRAQWKAAAPVVATCDNCRSAKLPHTACPTCGTYNKRQVLAV